MTRADIPISSRWRLSSGSLIVTVTEVTDEKVVTIQAGKRIVLSFERFCEIYVPLDLDLAPRGI